MKDTHTKAAASGKVLRGDRNQCPGCGLFFNSSHAFDKHRTGQHGIDRRCKTVGEMLGAGMVLGADGFWRGSAMPETEMQRHQRIESA